MFPLFIHAKLHAVEQVRSSAHFVDTSGWYSELIIQYPLELPSSPLIFFPYWLSWPTIQSAMSGLIPASVACSSTYARTEDVDRTCGVVICPEIDLGGLSRVLETAFDVETETGLFSASTGIRRGNRKKTTLRRRDVPRISYNSFTIADLGSAARFRSYTFFRRGVSLSSGS